MLAPGGLHIGAEVVLPALEGQGPCRGIANDRLILSIMSRPPPILPRLSAAARGFDLAIGGPSCEAPADPKGPDAGRDK
jgi:hypothetical protein